MRNNNFIPFFLWGVTQFILQVSCETNTPYPKPKAYLALSYPNPQYTLFESPFYKLPLNTQAEIKSQTERGLEVYYPTLNASLFLNYTVVNTPFEALEAGIENKLSEHVKKATAILEFPYEDVSSNKRGVLYEIKGDAASAAQFYVSDQSQNFLSGALYFNIRPHYDSIYPAAQYVIRDLRQIISGIAWKTKVSAQ
jgi:gliding motility-associated lipoprotein GldD